MDSFIYLLTPLIQNRGFVLNEGLDFIRNLRLYVEQAIKTKSSVKYIKKYCFFIYYVMCRYIHMPTLNTYVIFKTVYSAYYV